MKIVASKEGALLVVWFHASISTIPNGGTTKEMVYLLRDEQRSDNSRGHN